MISAQLALQQGEAFLASQNLPEAIAHLSHALTRDPTSDRAAELLAQAWLDAGEADQALTILDQHPHQNPSFTNLRRRAAQIKNQSRSDAGYIRHLFDQFSETYDDHMRGKLAYAAPELLRDLADMLGLQFAPHDILDLGCGTGLSGACFHDLARRLVGIDLSPQMIEQAQKRGLYDALGVADLESYLASQNENYDLLLAADTLVYLGDLDRVFAGAHQALRPGGHFLFTVEDNAGDSFALGPKRRWQHSSAYLRHLAEAHGFTISGLLACTPRYDDGQPIKGLAAALSKTP